MQNLTYLLLCLSFVAEAQKLYKYKNNQGIWHYTDRQPETHQDVEVRQLKNEPQRQVWLQQGEHERQPLYFAIS